MPEETRRDWEVIQEDLTHPASQTARLKVVNGWLYRTIVGVNVALVFVPGKLSDD